MLELNPPGLSTRVLLGSPLEFFRFGTKASFAAYSAIAYSHGGQWSCVYVACFVLCVTDEMVMGDSAYTVLT